MNIEIRKAENKDVPFILNLLYELGRPKPFNDKEVRVSRKKLKIIFLVLKNQLLLQLKIQKL